MKKKLSKIEIATYLRDYSKLMISARLNPNENIFELFKKMLIEEGRGQYAIKDYYFDMISIYEFFLLNQKYSFMSDKLLDFLLEDKLLTIDVPKNIFINQNDSNKFSKKKIIKYIRNAINHNDHDDRELYTIYKDMGKLKIEILLKNVKPIPFHIEISIHDYINLMSGIRSANKLDLTSYKVSSEIDFLNPNLSEELGKIIYRRYYYKHKIEKQDSNKFSEMVKENQISNELNDYLDELDISYTDYKLTPAQKLKILEDYEKLKIISGYSGDLLMEYIVPNVIPIGISKNNLLSLSLAIADYYAKSCEKSLLDVIEDARKLCINKNDKNNPLYDNNDFKRNSYLYFRTLDLDANINIILSIYYRYLFDTLITDDIVEINGKNYLREKIRNSFVHGRWFNGINGCFKLFDCDNGDKNELNYNWKASIPAKKLEEAVERYYNEIFEKKKDDSFLDYPISINVNVNNIPISIMLIKNSKKYIYNIDISSYTDEFIPWGLYIMIDNKLVFTDNVDDINTFFYDLEKSLLEDNVKFQYLFKFLQLKNKLCLEYKAGKISLEDLKLKDDLLLPLITNSFEIKGASEKIKK